LVNEGAFLSGVKVAKWKYIFFFFFFIEDRSQVLLVLLRERP
jgi:hypothetical protein